MTDDDYQPDPIAEAFRNYRRAPADVVPKKPWRGDYDALFDLDGQTVTVTYHDRETDRQVSEQIMLTHPVFGRKN